MPFKNNQYKPDKAYTERMKKLISDYLTTQTGLCKRKEFEQILIELRSIETDFFQQFDSSNVKQDWEFKDQTNFIAKAMEKFVIPRILTVLNELYEDRYQFKCLVTNESIKFQTDIAKKIWKERCKERERCPRGGAIIIVGRKVVLVKHSIGNCTNYGHSKGKIEFDETIQECVAREIAEELGLPFDSVYDLIRDKSPIKKNVRYNFDGLIHTVEHYYFIIVLSPKEYHDLRPNKYEIDEIELRSIETLPCCRNCSENPLVEYNDEFEEEAHSDYYMVSCANFAVSTSIVWNIINFVDEQNGNKVELDKYNEKHRSCQRKISAS